MGVIDELMRQEGMQKRLHRRVGGGGVDEIGAQQRHHVFVGKLVKLAALEQ